MTETLLAVRPGNRNHHGACRVQVNPRKREVIVDALNDALPWNDPAFRQPSAEDSCHNLHNQPNNHPDPSLLISSGPNDSLSDEDDPHPDRRERKARSTSSGRQGEGRRSLKGSKDQRYKGKVSPAPAPGGAAPPSQAPSPAAAGGGGGRAAGHNLQLALSALGGVPGHLTGSAEVHCSAVGFTLSVAAAAAAGGGLPPTLLPLVSPYRAHLEQLRQLGRGGFGSVVAVRSRLDRRLLALKEVPFRSLLPPWAPAEQLEAQHAKLLREVRALAALDGCPHVVRYYGAWIEPAWERLGQQLRRAGGGAAGGGGAGLAQASLHSVLTNWTAVQAAATAAAAGEPGARRGGPTTAAAAPVGIAMAAPALTSHTPALVAAATAAATGMAGARAVVRGPAMPGPMGRMEGGTAPGVLAAVGSGGRGGGGRGTGSNGGSGGGSSRRHMARCVAAGVGGGGAALVGIRGSPSCRIREVEDSQGNSSGSSSGSSSGCSSSDSDSSTEEEGGEQQRRWRWRRQPVAAPTQPIVALPPSSDSELTSTQGRRSLEQDDVMTVEGSPIMTTVFATGIPKHPYPQFERNPYIDQDPDDTEFTSDSDGDDDDDDTECSDSGGGGGAAAVGLTHIHNRDLRMRTVRLHGDDASEACSWTFDRSGHDANDVSASDGDVTDVVHGGVRMPVAAAAAARRSWTAHTVSRTRATPLPLQPAGVPIGNGFQSQSGSESESESGSQTDEHSWTFDRGADEQQPPPPPPPLHQPPPKRQGGGGAAAAAAVARNTAAGNGGGGSWWRKAPECGVVAGGGCGAGPRRLQPGSPKPMLQESRCRRSGDEGAVVKESIPGAEVAGSLFHMDEATIINNNTRDPSGADGSSLTHSGSSSGAGSSISSSSADLQDSHEDDDDDNDDEEEDNESEDEIETDEAESEEGDEAADSGSAIDRGHWKLSNPHCRTTPPRSAVPLLKAHRPNSQQQQRQPIVSSPPSEERPPLGPRLGLLNHPPPPPSQPPRRRPPAPPQPTSPPPATRYRAVATAAGAGGGGSPPVAPVGERAVLSGIRRWPYTLYISMELVVGPTLTRWLLARAEGVGVGGGRLGAGGAHPEPPATVERSVFRQIVTGLAHIHAACIIHRDLKPANIFLLPVVTAPGTPSYLVKIGDFGLAAADGQDPPFGTTTTATATTTTLMSASASTSSSGTLPTHTLASASTAQPAPRQVRATLAEGPPSPLRRAPSQPLMLPPPPPALPAAGDTATAAPPTGDQQLPSPAATTLAGPAPTITPATIPIPTPAPIPAPIPIPILSHKSTIGVGVGIGVSTAGVGAPGGAAISRLPSGSTTSAHTSGIGTASYSAPEQLGVSSSAREGGPGGGGAGGGMSYYGPEVDIYPLGLILLELFCIHSTGMERANALRDAREGRLPPSFCRTYPHEAALAGACLQPWPDRRPTAQQVLTVLNHIWGPEERAPIAMATASAAAAATAASAAGAPVSAAAATGGSGGGCTRSVASAFAATVGRSDVSGNGDGVLSLQRAASVPLPLPWRRHDAPPLLLLPPPTQASPSASSLLSSPASDAGEQPQRPCVPNDSEAPHPDERYGTPASARRTSCVAVKVDDDSRPAAANAAVATAAACHQPPEVIRTTATAATQTDLTWFPDSLMPLTWSAPLLPPPPAASQPKPTSAVGVCARPLPSGAASLAHHLEYRDAVAATRTTRLESVVGGTAGAAASAAGAMATVCISAGAAGASGDMAGTAAISPHVGDGGFTVFRAGACDTGGDGDDVPVAVLLERLRAAAGEARRLRELLARRGRDGSY